MLAAFKVGNKVRFAVTDSVTHKYSGKIGTVTKFSTGDDGTLFVHTDITSGGFFPWRFELVESVDSQQATSASPDRCEYLTVECLGLRDGNPITGSFKAQHNLVLEPRNCSNCGEPEWSGRMVLRVSPSDPTVVCADCYARGTPLTPLPIVEPLTASDCCAWETPCDDGVG